MCERLTSAKWCVPGPTDDMLVQAGIALSIHRTQCFSGGLMINGIDSNVDVEAQGDAIQNPITDQCLG